MWDEIRAAFQAIGEMPEVRAAILSGAGPHFTAGIDLELLTSLQPEAQNQCPGRLREQLRRFILDLQESITSVERCSKGCAT
jgi:enoyl-CoA hydratase